MMDQCIVERVYVLHIEVLNLSCQFQMSIQWSRLDLDCKGLSLPYSGVGGAWNFQLTKTNSQTWCEIGNLSVSIITCLPG